MSPDEFTEFRELTSQLVGETESLIQRIKNLKKYDNSGSVKRDELVIAFTISRSLEDRTNNPNNQISQLIQYINDPEIDEFKIKDLNIESIKPYILKSLSELADVNESLTDLEEKYGKFNLPMRDLNCNSNNEPYSKSIREFVEATWRKPAEISRGNGNKCLMEWMVKIRESSGSDKIEILMITKSVMFEIGVVISMLLVEYLWVISLFEEWRVISKRLLEMDNLITCLSIEEGSILISCFTEVVELFHQMLRSEKRAKMAGRAEKGKGVFEDEDRSVDDECVLIEKDDELFHHFMIEILRFEVSFRSPDLPMILGKEIYLFLADYLRKLFKKNLGEVMIKIHDLKMESRQAWMSSPFQETLKSEVNKIWNELAFNCTY